MGTGQGSPFPKPAFDSGWVKVEQGANFVLGGGQYLPPSQYHRDNFFVELMIGHTAGWHTNQGIGGDWGLKHGAYYNVWNDNDISVNVGEDEYGGICGVRVRVWYINC